MKKTILIFLGLFLIVPNSLRAQKNDNAAAIAGGLLAIGAGIAAIEQLKEQLEQKAVEQVLNEYPEFINFELKTNSLSGTKLKDLSSVSVITFEITNLDDSSRSILFAFLSSGWTNANGVDFNKISWKNFSKSEWNNLMKTYIETASKQSISLTDLQSSKIVNKGVKQGGKFILEFDKIKGDVYYTNDYSDEFKLVFNERSLGLFLKPKDKDKEQYRQGGVRGDLVQIRRKSIIKAHEHINNQ